MSDDVVHGWATVYPHLRYEDPVEAIAWLCRVFGFRERVRMARPDGSIITAKLEGPDGGLIMVAGISPDLIEWVRQRLPEFQPPRERSWPDLSHVTTVVVQDVDAHYERAKTAGATILMSPADQPWGLRVYAAIDLGGHQWEFSQVLREVEPESWGATRIE
jgi:PhnB protein